MIQIFRYNGKEYELPDANTWKYGPRLVVPVWTDLEVFAENAQYDPFQQCTVERLTFEMVRRDHRLEWRPTEKFEKIKRLT